MRRGALWGVIGWHVVLCAANAGSIRVSSDTSGITRGVPFQILVEIEGREITTIDLPEIDGAVISGEPNYSGTQINYVNGSLTSTKTLGYVITPERKGELIVPAFEAVVDGETIKSEPIRLTVQDSPQLDDASSRSIGGDRVLFIQIKTDKLEVYRGEAVTLSMEAWIADGTRVRYERTGFPELTGFYAVPREPGEPAERVALRDGQRYRVITFAQLLFPTSTGDLRVGPWTFTCDISRRGMVRGRQSKTEPFTIKVKPLPTSPSGFSGSVGTYQIVAALSNKATEVGVPVILTIGIVGDGNPDAIGAPKLPSIDGAYIDEPQTIDLAPQLNGPNGQNFVYKLTPQRPGGLTIPKIRYVYFDPGKGAYETAETDPLVLQVRDASKPEQQVVVGAGGADASDSSPGTDIHGLATGAGPIRRQGDHTPITVTVFAVPVFAYICLALYVRRQRRFATDRAYARAYTALRTGIERLAQARHSAAAVDSLYRAVTGYLADQFNLAEIGLTSAEAQLFLESRRIPEDVADAFTRILRKCERARYAAAELSADETGALIQGAETAMHRLDEYLKGGGRAA